MYEAFDKSNLYYNNIGRTTLIVTHRLSTMKNADVIITLKDGQVNEKGTHDELMKLRGTYYDLVLSQTLYEPHIKPGIYDAYSESDYSTVSSSCALDDYENDLKVKQNSFFYHRKIFDYQSSETPWIFLGSITQFISGGINPLIAIYFSQIYKIFTVENDEEKTNESLSFMLYIGIMSIIHFLTIFLSRYAFYLSESKLVKRLR